MKDSCRGSHSELADLKQGLAGNQILTPGNTKHEAGKSWQKCWPGRKPEDAFLAREKKFI